MTIESARLAFIALIVLDEAADAAFRDPVPQTPAIRLALACLYSIAAKPDRTPFDTFWQEIAKRYEGSHSRQEANYIRGTMARGCIAAMIRMAGFPPTPAFDLALRRSRLARGARKSGSHEAVPRWRGAISSETPPPHHE